MVKTPHLVFEHPETCPPISEPLGFLIDPPSFMASSASLVRFKRLTLMPLLAAKPDNPHLPEFVKAIDNALAWRSTIPQDLHFWRSDDRFARCAGCGRIGFVSLEPDAIEACGHCGGSDFVEVERSAVPSGVTLLGLSPALVWPR